MARRHGLIAALAWAALARRRRRPRRCSRSTAPAPSACGRASSPPRPHSTPCRSSLPPASTAGSRSRPRAASGRRAARVSSACPRRPAVRASWPSARPATCSWRPAPRAPGSSIASPPTARPCSSRAGPGGAERGRRGPGACGGVRVPGRVRLRRRRRDPARRFRGAPRAADRPGRHRLDGRGRHAAADGIGPDPRRPTGDGGPASAAVLSSPTDVAALAGGGFAVLDDGKVRIVGADGVIRATNAPMAVAIAPDPAGLLILEDGRARVAPLRGRRAQPRSPSLGRERRRDHAIHPGRQRPVRRRTRPIASDVVASPDGGVLVSADFAIDYIPPPRPCAARARDPPRHPRPGPGLTVSVTTTAPAQLRIGVWRRGRSAPRS